MANEKDKNTGQDPSVDPKLLSAVYKQIIRDQQDLSGTIRDILKDLNKTENTYKNIEARIDRISKGTVDVKGVQRELNKLVDREFITKKEYEKLSSKERLDRLEALKIDAKRAVEKNRGLKFEDAILSRLEKQQDHGLLELFYAEQALQLAEERRKKGEEQLKFERGVSKQMGISGNLMSMFAKKIGLGEDAYDEMSKKARELVAEQKDMGWWEKRMARFTGGFKVLGTGIASIGKSLFQSLSDPLVLIGAGGLLLKGLKSAFDFIVGIQDQTVKFGRAMNLSTGEARKIKMEFASLSISSGNLFITSQKMVESQMELTDALGVTNILSKEILATNIELKDIAGLDAQTRASIAESATITGKSAKETTKAVLNQVVGLKQATGIGFQYQKILKEASSLSGVLGLQFAKYPDKLAKALVTTKAMGLELSKLDSMADSFLDFESSISKEFEAQLLTGKNINLMKARELFLNNDLAGAAAEITRQVGTADEFLNMNRISAESMAAAFGMSRDQLADMLKQQELMAKLGSKQGDSAREQLKIGLERYKTQKELSAAIGEDAYQSLVNASAQEKIAAFVDKIKQSIADFVESSGIIDKVESMIQWLSEPENIRTTIMMVRDVFATIVGIVADIASGIITVLDVVGAISDQKAASAKAFLSGAESNIRSLGGDFGSVSVSDATTRNQSNTGMYQGAAPVNNSMASKQDLNVHLTAYLKETKKDAEVRIEQAPDHDRNTQSK